MTYIVAYKKGGVSIFVHLLKDRKKGVSRCLISVDAKKLCAFHRSFPMTKLADPDHVKAKCKMQKRAFGHLNE